MVSTRNVASLCLANFEQGMIVPSPYYLGRLPLNSTWHHSTLCSLMTLLKVSIHFWWISLGDSECIVFHKLPNVNILLEWLFKLLFMELLKAFDLKSKLINEYVDKNLFE